MPHPGPQFPGAGQSGSSAGIAAGATALGCDAPLPFGGRPTGPATLTCFYGDDALTPAATVEWIVEADPQGELVHVRLTLNPSFVDNTYGANAIGWGDTATLDPVQDPPKMPGKGMMPGKKPMGGPGGKGHTFKDLVGSDHAEFKLTDASGVLRSHFKADYISESTGARSGYASLGVNGGDGKMIAGSASDVVAVQSSLERNLNACGLGNFTTDSPATDSVYTANAAAVNWDYRVIYDVWVRKSAFGAAGFGNASVDFVHASPSKKDGSTVEVTPGECPPGWPPYCKDPEGCCIAVDGYCGGNPPVPPEDAGCIAIDGYCGGNPSPPRDAGVRCTGLDCGPIGY
ncbi:MAG: hypothetical protein ABW352_07185 [Polyangiales bacterium]